MAKTAKTMIANGWRYGVGLPCRLSQPYHYRNWQTALYRMLATGAVKLVQILN